MFIMKKSNYPGVYGKPFNIKLDGHWFKKNDFLRVSNNYRAGFQQVIVTKVYNRTWWRRLLDYFGFKTKLFDCIKVKPYEEKA